MRLEFEPLDLRLKADFSTARTRGNRLARLVLVTLTDADGTIGRGQAAPISRYGESVDLVLAFLGGVDAARLDAADLPRSLAYLELLSSRQQAARCALNCALLDIAAQRAGQPLHDFLGLGFREGRHVTSFSIGIDTPDRIRHRVESAADFPVLKIKLGADHDEDILRAVREVAPDKPLRVDANEGWKTRELALKRILHLADDGRIEFVEQPMPASTPVGDLTWLKQRSPLPLFADESFRSATDVAACIGCFDGVNVKLAKTAGVTGGQEALLAAKDAGLKTMLGCMVESSLGITAAAHLAGLADYLDLDGNLLIENDPFRGVSASCGRLSFMDAPGRTGMRCALAL